MIPPSQSQTEEIVSRPEKNSNFYFAFFFLPKTKRDALSAVYAYCRLIDDIVDSGSLGKDEAARMLAFWREEVERLYAGRPTHSLSAALAGFLEPFRLPKAAFLEVIRGCEMDLNRSRYETFEQLESYMQGVAGAVGSLSVEIFGYAHTPPEKIAEYAKYFGYAFQLTNIIRDVGADLENGRIYLPLSDIEECGYSADALARREHNAAFSRLMNKQYERAKGFYRRARAALDHRDRSAMLPAEVMAHIYEGLLDEIRAGGFRVLFGRTSQSTWVKLRQGIRAWIYCHGL